MGKWKIWSIWLGQGSDVYLRKRFAFKFEEAKFSWIFWWFSKHLLLNVIPKHGVSSGWMNLKVQGWSFFTENVLSQKQATSKFFSKKLERSFIPLRKNPGFKNGKFFWSGTIKLRTSFLDFFSFGEKSFLIFFFCNFENLPQTEIFFWGTFLLDHSKVFDSSTCLLRN